MMVTQAESLNARSWLFAPGDSERKMEKATAGAADIVLLDLEDAVAEGEKSKARSMVTTFLNAHPLERARLWVRINPLQGPHALADLAVPAASCCPKCADALMSSYSTTM
jgi:citrate lyase subunit beta/citryl-CoA lyase